jgi:hypothetical protein
MGYSVTWYRMIREMLRERPEERPSLEDINVLQIANCRESWLLIDP